MKVINAAIQMPRVTPKKRPVRISFQAMRMRVPLSISPRASARMTMVADCPPEFPPAATTMGRKSDSTNAFSRVSEKRNMTYPDAIERKARPTSQLTRRRKWLAELVLR